MTAMRAARSAASARSIAPISRFEIGDQVLIEPEQEQGMVIGVRYGMPAYDVLVNGVCLRNLPLDEGSS
jgi:hypothetical protein